jgi:hypothetical protein
MMGDTEVLVTTRYLGKKIGGGAGFISVPAIIRRYVNWVAMITKSESAQVFIEAT